MNNSANSNSSSQYTSYLQSSMNKQSSSLMNNFGQMDKLNSKKPNYPNYETPSSSNPLLKNNKLYQNEPSSLSTNSAANNQNL